jgi:hypothetical protein
VALTHFGLNGSRRSLLTARPNVGEAPLIGSALRALTSKGAGVYYRLMEQWATQAGPEGPPGNRAWEEALERLKETVSVRQYSPKTFKTYRTWIRDFQAPDTSPSFLPARRSTS